MRKIIVTHSFLMISSVFALNYKPLHIVRQTPTSESSSQPSAPGGQSTAPTSPSSTPSEPSPTSPTASPTKPPLSIPSLPPLLPGSPTSPSASSISSSTTSISSETSSSTSTSASDTSSPSESIISSISTNAQGSVTTVIVTSTNENASTGSPTPTSAPEDDTVKPNTIIGLSVAGGVALIALIAFIIWKLTRKRFSDLDDPDEAIKWPELNRDTHAGGGESLSRQLSNAYSSAPSRNASTFDQSELADPYAVPPLPQFNPNQPYHDDPYAATSAGYYDPYRGPIPQTFNDGSLDGHESIPMNTYPTGSRTKSPGPGTAFDLGGRGSPGPGMQYDGGRGSPALGRTVSPGPATGLGSDNRQSPGPHYAIGGQPEMSTRTRSPGPNTLG